MILVTGATGTLGKPTVELLAASGVPHTILRTTQFHSIVARLSVAERQLPVAIVPSCSMQPVSVDDVARRLIELVDAGPSGRVRFSSYAEADARLAVS